MLVGARNGGFLIQRLGSSFGEVEGTPWGAMGEKSQETNARHHEDDNFDWFLAKNIPSGERWYHAEQHMLKMREEGLMMKMEQVFDKIRRDLSTQWVAWYPQKWTTMVEGRPVQVQVCILPHNPLAEPDARQPKCHGHGDLHKDI